MCGGGGREKKERVLGGEAGGRRRGTCGGEYLSSACIQRVHTARAYSACTSGCARTLAFAHLCAWAGVVRAVCVVCVWDGGGVNIGGL